MWPASYHQSPFAPQRRDDGNFGAFQFDPPASTGLDGQPSLTGNQQASIDTSIHDTAWNTYNIHSSSQAPSPHLFHQQQLSWPGNMFMHNNNPAIYSFSSQDGTMVTPQSHQSQTSFHPLITSTPSIQRRSDQLLNPISVF